MNYLHGLWNSLESTRRIHNWLELFALVCFAVLVIADALSHVHEEEQPKRSRMFAGYGLWFFAAAVLMEVFAYPIGLHADRLARDLDAQQRHQIVLLQDDDDRQKAEIHDAEARVREAEAQVASARTESQKASAKAEGFRLEIARSNEKAAVATKTAEEDRLARLKMEQELKSRNLSAEQQSAIIHAIKPFAGTPYELAVNETAEPLHFAEQIDEMLRSANWVARENASTKFRFIIGLTSGTKAEQTFATGVSIRLTHALDKQYGKSAEALISALRANGIPATGAYLDDSDASPSNVHVIVGSQALIQ